MPACIASSSVTADAPGLMNLRGPLERYLTEVWYQRDQPPWFLRALEPLYRYLSARQRTKGLAARRSLPPLGVPVMVVGNLTAGGTGKTPLIIRVVEMLLEHGIQPGIISRGYGGKPEHSDEVIRLSADSDVRKVGDEPLMLFRRLQAPVAVSVNRVAAARVIESEVDIIISDDGLQHYRLPRDLELAVIDAARGFGNGHLLPAGPLREPVQRLQSVDFVIENGDGSVSRPERYKMQLLISQAEALEDSRSRSLESFSGTTVQVITAIGHPERFITALERQGITVEARRLPDHHVLSVEEFKFLRQPDLPLLITEKDAVKLQSEVFSRTEGENVWIIPARTLLDERLERGIMNRVQALISKSKKLRKSEGA